MESSAVSDLCSRHLARFAENGEFRSLSIDSTYKLSLKVTGQTASQKNNFTTILGLRGSPVAIAEGNAEAPKAVREQMEASLPARHRALVEHVALDQTSAKMHSELKRACPGLQCISLDAMHLCFAVDKHTTRKGIRPTVVGLVLRSIMGKFNVRDDSRRSQTFYTRVEKLTQTTHELLLLSKVHDGSMPRNPARECLTSMDPNTPISSRTEFVRLIAALVVVYPERLDKVMDKTGAQDARRSLSTSSDRVVPQQR